MYNVYCVKWGDKYNRDFVTRLKDNVESNTTLDIKFWCYTDQPEEDYDIPIKYPYLRGVWHKLALFEFTGPSVFFDLDIEIKKNIDFLFTDFGELTLIDSTRWKKYNFENEQNVFRFKLNNDSKVNSSFMRWNDCQFIFEKFMHKRDNYLRLYKGIDRFIYNEDIPYKVLDNRYVSSWHIVKDADVPIFLWNQRY